MTTAFYTHADCRLHEMGAGHPESPARLQAIEDQLIASRLDSLFDHREAPLATPPMICRVHDAAMLDLMRARSPARVAGSKPGESYAALGPDAVLNAYTLDAALRAAGAAVAATDAVIAGEVENAFCSVRPPGHHALRAQAMGFCFFNNVAIAAQHALAVHGLSRIAVVDFDVHHGNGTQEAFEGDQRVLMVSFFQHPFYPFTGVATAGEGYDNDGKRYSSDNMINQPLPAYTGGNVVRRLVKEVWLPALHAHRPEMLFISAGFDAHREDDIGQMGLVEDDYAWITRELMTVARQHAGGRIVSCLEGGYNLSALGRSVVAHLKALAQLD
ncbi:MAG: histone deacetylase family protein [Pseudomonadota bacterium]